MILYSCGQIPVKQEQIDTNALFSIVVLCHDLYILTDHEGRVFQSSIATKDFQKSLLICSASGATKTPASALRFAGPAIAVSEPFRSHPR